MQPSENIKLYCLENFFKELTYLYNDKKMPNKILLSGKKGLGKSTMAYHLVNFILSNEEEFQYNSDKMLINKENKSYKLIQNNSHPNFYPVDLFDEKKNIDVAQIREMISYTNKSCFNKKPRLILIDNIENLNISSVNALLKIVEEPNENIFFILIHNNEKSILSTLRSRCLTFKINLSFTKCIEVTNKLLGKNILDLINHELFTNYNTPGDLINLLDFANERKINLKKYSLVEFLTLLIDNGYYKKNKIIKDLLLNFIELFFLKKYNITDNKNSVFNNYHEFLLKINNTNKFNLDYESLFLEFKSKILNG